MLIDRRGMIGGGAALALSGPAWGQRRNRSDWFDRAIVIDGLGGLGDPHATENLSRLTDRTWKEMQDTGVTVLRSTVFPVGNTADPWGDYQKAIVEAHQAFSANPDRLLLVRSAADILAAKRTGKFGIVIGTQDSCMVSGDLERVAQLKKDGVMSVQLTYNNGNLAGDGALEPRDSGLTKLGRKTIERVEAEKLLLDLSHGGARTMAEAAAHAKRPLVISHTGARALIDHPRNTGDATIKAVADKGGVVGIYLMPFLHASMKPTGDHLIAHIDHVARIAGEDHVGIGSDNGVMPVDLSPKAREELRKWQEQRAKAGIAAPGEGPDFVPVVEEYNSIDRYRRLANVLERRGWSVARLEKLFGGNFLRVYKEAWGG